MRKQNRLFHRSVTMSPGNLTRGGRLAARTEINTIPITRAYPKALSPPVPYDYALLGETSVPWVHDDV